MVSEGGCFYPPDFFKWARYARPMLPRFARSFQLVLVAVILRLVSGPALGSVVPPSPCAGPSLGIPASRPRGRSYLPPPAAFGLPSFFCVAPLAAAGRGPRSSAPGRCLRPRTSASRPRPGLRAPGGLRSGPSLPASYLGRVGPGPLATGLPGRPSGRRARVCKIFVNKCSAALRMHSDRRGLRSYLPQTTPPSCSLRVGYQQ